MSEWKTLPLRELAEIRVSNVDKKSVPGEQPVLLCNYMDVYSNEYLTEDLQYMSATATTAEIGRFSVGTGDVAITKDSETPDDIGIPAVARKIPSDLVCGYHLALIKPDKTKINGEFLAKQLASNETIRYFAQRASGSTRYGLSNGAIASTLIPHPPLPQQRRIAEILSTVDAAIEATEALIAKQQQIKAGLMHDLFTRGVWTDASIQQARQAGLSAADSARVGQLRPAREIAPELYKESPLGWIPKDWEVKLCAEISKRICVGIVIQPTQYYQEAGVSAFRSANIRENGLTLDDLVYISPEANAILANSQVKGGDIVTVRTGYPGTSAVVPDDWGGHNCIDILITTPGERVLSKYLSAWINSSFGKNQVLSKQGGLAQQHFNVGALRELKVRLPAIEEQHAIVERLESINEELSKNDQYRHKMLLKKHGLMQDLLT